MKTLPPAFQCDAPAILHAKLDRAWLCREDEGAVTHSTTIRDPDSPGTSYYVTVTLARSYP